MKGKILVGLLLWLIGAIYAFLVYPLLQTTDIESVQTPVTSSDARSMEENNMIDSYTSGLLSIPTGQAGSKWQETWIKTICFQTHCFSIEIADTFASRQQWLMNREYLAQNAGMLFVFDTPGSYGFWMKNTLIPLDIVRLDENLLVVDTATMTPCLSDPCPTYNHQWIATYALEINAGLLEKYAITIGSIFIQK